MHSLEFPAGSTIRFAATAALNVAAHRWDIEVFDASAPTGPSAPRLTYGSRIGGNDRDQRVDIPAQQGDCRLEVRSRHAVVNGWEDDACIVNADTPDQLALGFSDASLPGSDQNDVVLSFALKAPTRSPPAI